MESEALRSLLVAIAVGLLLGVLTAYGQFWLPEEIGSLANSAGSWCLVAFGLALLAPSARSAAASAALTLAALEVGYVLGNGLRGYPSATATVAFWSVAAILVGPPLGLGAHWVRSGSPAWAAAGAGGLSGLLVGEGVFGLTEVAETTYPPYWWGEIAVGVGALLWIAVRRLRRPGPIGLALLVAVVVAAAFLLLYNLELILLFF